MTPLIFAAAIGSTEIVEKLLEAGADPAKRDWANGSALDYATSSVMFELIARTLFPEWKTRDQRSLEWLREYDGFSYNAGAWESTPLSRAIVRPSLIFFTPLLTTEEPETVSARKVDDLALERIRILLGIGANPNERLMRGGADWTPLGTAIAWRRIRGARELLQSGADPNQRWCTAFEAPTGVRPDYAATKDARCTLLNGKTALMWSAEAGNATAVELLLEFNADRSLKDWAGRSALDYAKDRVVRDLLSDAR